MIDTSFDWYSTILFNFCSVRSHSNKQIVLIVNYNILMIDVEYFI